MSERKQYYWLKLKRDFFKRHDIRIIEGMPNGKDYILFYLKLLCESVDHEGNLRFSDKIPYSAEMLATITGTNVDVVKSAVQIFTQLGMMEILDDGTIYMSEVQKMLGFETNWASQKRDQRERIRAAQDIPELEDGGQCPPDVHQVSSGVHQMSSAVHQEIEIEKELDIDIEKDKEKDKEKEKKKPAEPSVLSVIAEADLEDGVKTALREFSKSRTAMKAKMTPNAMQLLIKNLLKLSTDPGTQIAIINQSILNGWKGVYALKEERKQPQEAPKKPAGKFYDFEEHPHTENSDDDFERAILRKQREERMRKRREESNNGT